MKKKIYQPEKLYVVNHENGTIYNDVVKFNKDKMPDALKSYESFPKTDATILVRGADGKILQRKGNKEFVG